MTKFNKLKFYILAVLPMLFWGVSYVWVKVVYKYYGPISTTFIRLTISGSILLVFSLFLGKFNRIKREDFLMFFLLTLIDPLGYFACESIGLTHVSALIGSIIISTIPVFSVLLGTLMLKEKLSAINFAGAAISFIGIAIMVLTVQSLTYAVSFTASPLGIALMFGAVLCAVIYSVIIKTLAERYSGFTIITVQNCVGAIYFLPLFFIFEFKDFVKVIPNLELVSNLLLLAVFGSTLAFIIYISIISKIGISKTNMFVNLISVFTLLASYFILKEQMTMKSIIGMIIVITGLYLSQIQKNHIEPVNQ